MGIAINAVTDNGTHVTYARVIHIEMDYQTRASKVVMGGYPDKDSRKLDVKPASIKTGEFVMPDPIPENIVAHCYEQLAAGNPDMDFTEV